MTGRKRKATSQAQRVRTRSENTNRWDLNEPDNWSSAELVNKLKSANIIVPLSLKKSQLIQMYRECLHKSNNELNFRQHTSATPANR